MRLLLAILALLTLTVLALGQGWPGPDRAIVAIDAYRCVEPTTVSSGAGAVSTPRVCVPTP